MLKGVSMDIVRVNRMTKKQFEYFLYQCKLEGIISRYDLVELDDVYEYVYEIRVPYSYNRYYLYSSISVNSDKDRDYGEDRVRCVFVDKHGNEYKRMFRCNRTTNVYSNVARHLRKLA